MLARKSLLGGDLTSVRRTSEIFVRFVLMVVVAVVVRVQVCFHVCLRAELCGAAPGAHFNEA
jgi:hypothetical protein